MLYNAFYFFGMLILVKELLQYCTEIRMKIKTPYKKKEGSKKCHIH